MRVCVVGLWHLGSVTATCLASRGHTVIGFDDNSETIAGLSQGHPPLFEPGLEELTRAGLQNKTLSFTTSPSEALRDAQVVWIAYDTPVDENDVADVVFVEERICALFSYLPQHCIVLISSQVPVGTTSRVEQLFQSQHPEKTVYFAYSPENLRLGSAIKVFTEPDRIVVGCNSEQGRKVISQLLAPITEKIEWMSITSAEMVKHAINAFLATSVTFINEVATLCEYTGANAKEVERGLKSESRIGPKAYLSPGAAFAGGTLARDIAFLGAVASRHNVAAPLLASVPASNLHHNEWPYRRIADTLGSIKGKRIAVWGLTYKVGTSTLRRSSSVELCRKLSGEGATVIAFDPAISELPKELQSVICLSASPIDATKGADALIISTPWSEFREVSMVAVAQGMSQPIILDANGTLSQQCSGIKGLRYFSVGISA